ncbi:MAG: cytochrome C554 and C-prime, partial [Leptospiraceae bacterium]|nr:cytochrome C554 and C-prime [Leptospiraceae bacterium]
ASDCGHCHQDHYREWSGSTHAHALSDLQFQSELSKPTSPQWLCLNCHIPVGNQRKEIVESVMDGDLLQPIARENPSFDEKMREEGVTCATCHLRQVQGKTVVVGPLGTGKAPHPVVVDPQGLRNRCLDCHNVTYKVASSLVCFFNTGNELHSSNLAAKACSDCHMPEVQRSIANKDGPIRLSHRHYFIGGGVPKEFGLMNLQEAGGYRSGLGLSADYGWDPKTRKWNWSVRMENLNTGHDLPTGDPERFIRITVTAFYPGGRIEQNYRIGQIWEWDPEARQIQDNRLYSGEVRYWKGSSELPARPIRIHLKAEHVRLIEKNAKYMEYTADRAAPEFRNRIRNLRQHYPMSRVLLEEDYLMPIPGSQIEP